ncbi:MAG: DeoR family transcriptional regulator [Paludibacteraceae bacterium]|nr:DeoR family transcriptional regulator [Paludibacteraceae bacterium]
MGTTESGKKDAQDVTINVLETSASLAKYFQVAARTIRRDLSALQSQGIIRRVGPGRGGHWEIIEQQ